MSKGKARFRYVDYHGVSTVQSGQVGFNIEVQRAAAQDYVVANSRLVVAEFSEVMSGAEG